MKGRSFENDKHRPLRVVKVNYKRGWAIVCPKKKSIKEMFVCARLFDKSVRRGCETMSIGHPWSINHCLLRGRVTYECRFDHDYLVDELAIDSHKSYLSVDDFGI
ncbi:hypothetical protein Leryth_021294 [Lithospermum erythrorhizon]|nr:hypothetical protein Leryth_021294 [Lithospermum erythrorhizon]